MLDDLVDLMYSFYDLINYFQTKIIQTVFTVLKMIYKSNNLLYYFIERW